MYMKRLCVISLFVFAVYSSPYSVSAQQTFQFAPDRSNTQQSAQSTTPTSSDSGLSTQLAVIAEWESAIAAKIPQSLKDKVNGFDLWRQAKADKYAELRDIAGKDATISVKTKPSTKDTTVSFTQGPGYYWYFAVALFFEKMYLFYGAILVGSFLLLRIILRYFNIIV